MKNPIFGSFLTIFWSFLPKPDFSVKTPQTIPQGALIPCQISQKLMCKFQQNLQSKKTEGRTEGWRKDRQKDGRKDGRNNRQTLTNPDRPSSHDWGSNKTFA